MEEETRTQFDIAHHTQQHVITLNIPMNDPMSMQMLQPLARLPRHRGDLALGHKVRGDHIREGTTLHVLHHDPEVVLVQERIDVVDDVRVARAAHDQDLVDDQILLGLLLEVHLLDRDAQVRAHLVCGVYTSGCTVNGNQ